MDLAKQVHDALQKVCPINGVSIRAINDKSTWRIDFANQATDEQKAAAYAVVTSFDTTTSIPQQVTMAQTRVALRRAELLQSVEAAVDQIGGEVKDAWEYSHTVTRQSGLVKSLGQSLGLTESQIDNLFVAASKIEF